MFAVSFPRRSTTRLSWFGARILRCASRFADLARLSLVLAGTSMLSGCLVDDPPPFVAPRKTAPRLDHRSALPGMDQVIVTKAGELIPFSIPVTSEDAGDPLAANLLLDYAGDGSVPDFLRPASLPPSTLDATEPRVIKVPWKVREGVPPGCHRFTLRVTHQSNVNKDAPELAIDKADQAEAYWFANINVDPEDSGLLVDCPGGGAP